MKLNELNLMWVSVEELKKPEYQGTQQQVFFCDKGWACGVVGMATIFEGEITWAEYDQQKDKFYAFEHTPTLFVFLPSPPERMRHD